MSFTAPLLLFLGKRFLITYWFIFLCNMLVSTLVSIAIVLCTYSLINSINRISLAEIRSNVDIVHSCWYARRFYFCRAHISPFRILGHFYDVDDGNIKIGYYGHYTLFGVVMTICQISLSLNFVQYKLYLTTITLIWNDTWRKRSYEGKVT